MKESLLTDVFWHAGFFLALSALVIPMLRYFKVPVALGYLFAGIALGPYGLGGLAPQLPVIDAITLKEAAHVKIMAELGIVLLLFVIGLELTPRRLWQMRSLVFGLGGAQVVITASIIGIVALMWGNSPQVSLLLGLSLALSSTAMVIQWLHEQKLFITHMGRSSFSILLFQDLAVIPILLLLTILSSDTGDNLFEFVSVALLKMGLTVLAIYFIGKMTFKPVFKFANSHGGSEVFMALSLLVIVVCASIASIAGLSMALGAFIAGLLLADTEYRHEISSLVIPFKSMLLGIFFFSFGMGINLSFIALKPLWLFLSVFGLMALKATIIFILCKLWKQSTAVAAESSILLSQAGEFGLLVVGSALAANLMTEDIGQFMLIIVGMTMLLSPIIAPLARKVGEFIEHRTHSASDYEASHAENKSQHIVIFGFGRVGKSVGDTLSQEGFDILGFDKNIERVHIARLKSSPVYFGDVTRKSTLQAAQLDKALCVVITINDFEAIRRIVTLLRNTNASIPIVVRAQNIEDTQMFEKLEHIDAIAEDVLIGSALSEKILQHCGNKHETPEALGA
ncbi:MAG: cation:proton antiporter [Alphaproteobacteria bacterium]|nr:cation:proton antiporter [Alphaproteobacteria bacterium]